MERVLQEPITDYNRIGIIRAALLLAYKEKNRKAIEKHAKSMQKYIDEGGDFPFELEDSLEDYEGSDPEKLTDQYILRLLRDRHCDEDDDQEYIATGLKKGMRVHTVIKCLGREFTFAEWCDYLNNERPEGDIAFVSADGYKFNIHDVCRNPTEAVNIRLDQSNYVVIGTAKSPNGRYDYSLDYAIDLGGGGSGASFIADINKGYGTKEEAILHALGIVEGYANRNGSKNAKAMLARIAETRRSIQHPEPIQLSLFDF